MRAHRCLTARPVPSNGSTSKKGTVLSPPMILHPMFLYITPGSINPVSAASTKGNRFTTSLRKASADPSHRKSHRWHEDRHSRGSVPSRRPDSLRFDQCRPCDRRTITGGHIGEEALHCSS